MTKFAGILSRLRWWRRSHEPAQLDPDDPGLITVVRAFDETEAASAVLARSEQWAENAPAVLRHHLRLPEDRFGQAAELLEQDGWRLRQANAAEIPEAAADHAPGTIALLAERVQQLDALHCSQENSRMAGLAQRLHGGAIGWEALQRPAGDVPRT